jgi:arylformamidase
VSEKERSPSWIDATEPIRSGLPVWPGDPAVILRPLLSRGPFRVSRLSLSTHAGTHIDPPYHWRSGRQTVDEIRADLLAGTATVVRSFSRDLVSAADVADALEARPRRLLIRTANSGRDFSGLVLRGGFVAVSEEAARAVVRAGVRLLGIDGPSVDPARSRDWPAHRICLEAGCVLLEGLRLRRIGAGACELMALPLRLERGDGAPARVFIRALGRP